jgi:hypothetical protein
MPGGTLGVLRDLKSVGARMATVKAVADPGWLQDVKQIDDRIPTVGRFIHGVDRNINVEGPPLDGDLQETAVEVMDNLLPKWAVHRAYVDYWEIVNEQDPPGPDGHRRMAEFMMHCIDIAEREGYRLALFSYSMGVPEWEEWEAIVQTGVFAEAKAGGHVLSLHEYAYPMDVWFGEPLPGRPTYPDRGPLACRYRWLYEDFLKPRDEVIPLYLTEVNLARDLPLVTVDEWMEQMAWYDERLREDYYVVGCHIFTLGAGGGEWQKYDITNMLPALVEHIISLKDVVDPTWPTGAPGQPERPGPGEGGVRLPVEPPDSILGEGAREAFARHYLLLPPDAGWRWLAACRRYWEAFHVTIGSSADDAGYGPGLTERAVTAVNPDRWPTDLKAFFDEHYPGVTYDPVFAATPEALEQALNRRVAAQQRLGGTTEAES